MTSSLKRLVAQIEQCRLCEAYLPLGPRPVLQAGSNRARILVASQAPGTKVHASGRPFTDKSGERLREWMGVDETQFYDPRHVAIIPMGFCYPGRGKGGDLPPRPECAPAWRAPLLALLPRIELTLAIGRYAIDYHLPGAAGSSVTDVVRRWREFWPTVVPLPHPSPRNNLWLRRNPWFEAELVPQLRQRVTALLRDDRPKPAGRCS